MSGHFILDSACWRELQSLIPVPNGTKVMYVEFSVLIVYHLRRYKYGGKSGHFYHIGIQIDYVQCRLFWDPGYHTHSCTTWFPHMPRSTMCSTLLCKHIKHACMDEYAYGKCRIHIQCQYCIMLPVHTKSYYVPLLTTQLTQESLNWVQA